MNKETLSIFIKQINKAQKIAKTRSKRKILLDLKRISDSANNNKLKNLQKAFNSTMILAYAFGFATDNRYFPRCLEEPYMNAYGSSDDANPCNFSIANKGSISNLQEVIGNIKFVKNIPKNDYYFTLFVNYKGHKDLNVAHPLTRYDIHNSIHHALISVFRDKLF